MQEKPPHPPGGAERRRRAEDRLHEQHPETDPPLTNADAQRLVHELQVHQVELEMQNEELRHARDEVEAGLAQYSDLYDFAPVGYVTLDREGTIREANLTAASLLAIERSRLVGRRLGSYVSTTDRPAFAAFLSRVFERKVKLRCEVTLLREAQLPLEVQLAAVVTPAGQECRTTLEDITERKKVEEQRLILSKLESTGILAGGLAHDFNNLLTVLLFDLELVRGLDPGEEALRIVEDAEKTVLMARGLTGQLIAFAQGGAPVRKPIRLAQVVQDAALAALAGARVRCEFSLADELWSVEADEGQIGQVIRNLVLNAREAMPQGGTISVRAENAMLGPQEHASLPPGDFVRMSVADRGGGIAEDVLPRIFDPYFSTKRRGEQKGMGLGLTICHTVIRKHGGAIAVESIPRSGTTFHVYLPACRQLREVHKAAAAAPACPRPGRILVMDDEDGLRTLVGKYLQRLGHEVELVPEGQRAVEAYADAKHQGNPFDAVLLDLTVRAGVGGQEAIRALLEIDPGVKAIVMSGYTNDPMLLEPERYGFKGVLPKPFDADNLRETIARVIGSGDREPMGDGG